MKTSKWLKYLLSGVPIVAGVFLILSSFFSILDSYETNSWNKVDGWIVDIPEKNGLFSRFSYKAHNSQSFKYRYEVSGLEYEGSTIGFGINSLNKDYFKGDQVEVFYDPRNPKNSVLVSGLSYKHLSYVFVGGIIIFFSIQIQRRV